MVITVLQRINRLWRAFTWSGCAMLTTMPIYADTIDTSGQAPWEQCGYCHEYDGNTRMANFPRLAGQWPAYLRKQLLDFRAGRRAGTMTATAEMLGDTDIQQVVEYFSQQQPVGLDLPMQEKAEAGRARELYLSGDASRGIEPCAACHGTDGGGQGDIPVLAAQQPDYLQQQLLAFRNNERRNDPDAIMRKVAASLTDADIRALTNYLSRLTAVKAPTTGESVARH